MRATRQRSDPRPRPPCPTACWSTPLPLPKGSFVASPTQACGHRARRAARLLPAGCRNRAGGAGVASRTRDGDSRSDGLAARLEPVPALPQHAPRGRSLAARRTRALDMSRLSTSGSFHQSNAILVAVPLAGGGTATVEVTVWRRVSNPSLLYLSTRPEGGSWQTQDRALDMSRLSGSGLFHQSSAVLVEVPLPDTARLPLPASSLEQGRSRVGRDLPGAERRWLRIRHGVLHRRWRVDGHEPPCGRGADPRRSCWSMTSISP